MIDGWRWTSRTGYGVPLFLLLSKTLDWLLSPLSWTIVLAGLALVLHWRRRPRAGRVLGVLAAVVLLAFSSEPVSNGLYAWAEAGAARTFRDGVAYDAVIVLGGGLDPDATATSGEPEFNAAAERALRGFELVRSGRAKFVLLSAGTLDPDPAAVPESTILARQLRDWGLDPAQIVEEPKSRNTRENAVESARIARDRGWSRLVLVTSAAHMPRALGCFRAAGLDPDTLPVDYRHTGKPLRSLAPRAVHLAESADALRELAGRVVYRAAGYSR